MVNRQRLNQILLNKDIAHRLFWIGYCSLFTIVLIWTLWLMPASRHPAILIAAIGLLPLALPLRGALNAQHRAFFWMSLISLLYLFHGIGAIAATLTFSWPAVLEMIAALVLCGGAWLSMRVIKKTAKQDAS